MSSYRRVFICAMTLATAVTASVTSFASAATRDADTSASTISASRCAANRAAGPITFASPFGFDASAGIIDVFAASALGYFKSLCLKVNFVTSSFTPDELVSAGRATVTGEGSAADALAKMANGAHFEAIATYGDTSDYALLTSPSISNLSQLAGKTLGYHTTLPVVLSEMLQRVHVATAKVHEVSLSTFDPNVLPEGRVQALQAYQSNEPLTLRAEHKAFREWTPAQLGVQGTFNVVVVNTTFLNKHRGATTDFLRAELRGFSYCSSHAVGCIRLEQHAALAEGATYNVVHSLAEWQLESKLATQHDLVGKGVGVESIAEWQPEAAAVRAAGVAHVPALAAVENTSIAASLYHDGRLIWPGP